MLSAAPRQAISSSASSSKVTDPALAAILQRRRLLSEPQEATAPAPAVESPAVAVRPGIVQEALAAIEERRAEPPPKAVQCFDMATDSESEDAEQCRPASCRGWWRAVEVTPSHRARRPRATRTSRPPRWKSGASRGLAVKVMAPRPTFFSQARLMGTAQWDCHTVNTSWA